jgi:hypothetical protein
MQLSPVVSGVPYAGPAFLCLVGPSHARAQAAAATVLRQRLGASDLWQEPPPPRTHTARVMPALHQHH